ncbi:serine hydrolase domain-containing protein [Massilia sp. S19_KUP03_FR1]|uniref:serine hydrolase domain-containing protein n=1 Tax=Massilia sp. S19_KUP03_FR1 TaxID=3025503 RepID=UPI002FCDB523
MLALNLGFGGTVLAQDAAANNTVAAPAPVAADIDKLMSRYFKADRPGAIVLVTKDGNTIFRKAYGMANLEQQIALQPEMALRIGSITKQFTAAAIMLLAEQGKLSLADDITKYLPAYATHGSTITIENLLTHTAGIKNYTALPKFPSIARTDMTVAQMLQLIQSEALEFRPGERFAYSNSGYFLLGAIIEQVSGSSYASFMEKNIFAPLQLQHTFYDSNVRVIPSRVEGYSKTRHGFDNAEFLSLSIPYAAGALRSSVDDLARWNGAIVAGKLLRPESWKRMMSSSILSNGKPTGYGYGWFVRKIQGRDAIEHGGDINGFSGDTVRFPAEGYYIAILVNSDTQEPDTQTLAEKIAALLLR